MNIRDVLATMREAMRKNLSANARRAMSETRLGIDSDEYQRLKRESAEHTAAIWRERAARERRTVVADQPRAPRADSCAGFPGWIPPAAYEPVRFESTSMRVTITERRTWRRFRSMWVRGRS